MAYREGDRCQMTLLPPVIEEYVGQNDPVRAYDAIVDAMDTDKTGFGRLIVIRLAILLMIPRPCLSYWFMAIPMAGAVPESWKGPAITICPSSGLWEDSNLTTRQSPISERTTKRRSGQVLKQTARICLRMDLIEGNCLFTDSIEDARRCLYLLRPGRGRDGSKSWKK